VKELAACHVVVAGLGLMGSSLAAALGGHCSTVSGLARRTESIEQAVQRGFIDQGTVDPKEILPEADIVVLATPVRTILRQIDEYGPLLADGCLLVDLGSTKREILEAMDHLPRGIQPLGGHPMCGKERSGLAAADPELYAGCTFILSPLERTSPAALDLGRELIKAIGGRPIVLDAARQDHLAATLSHLPYLLACSLVRTADCVTSSDPAAWEIVAGGYRDTSRVAGSDVTMMLDILSTNRREVLESAAVFRNQFDHLIGLLENEDEDGLAAILTHSRAERWRMFP
jgi:prephenate dehydrogenase